MPDGPPLPFADFLAALRCHGLHIGLREHQAAARLLAEFSGGDPLELSAALAALLAASPDEVRLIRELFRLHYTDALRPPAPVAPPPPRSRWRALAIQLGLGLLFALLLLLKPMPRPTSERPAGAQDLGPVRAPDAAPAPPDPGEPPPSAKLQPLPPVDPARVHSWPRQLVGALIPAGLLAAGLYLLRRRVHRRRRHRDQLREQLDRLPGPSDYQLVLRDLRPPLMSDDLEDVATVLARLTSGESSGGRLDVRQSIERSLRTSPLIELVFAPRLQGHPLVILQDTGPAMRPWTRKVEAFIQGMAKRGVAVERYCFDPDPTQVFASTDAPLRPLEDLMRHAADSPLLLLSTGAGAVTLLGQLRPWVHELKRWRRRAWLHPLNNPSLWHPALDSLPCKVWPMTRDGLLGASYELARDEDRTLHTPHARRRAPRGVSPRDVSPRDVERLKRLVALVPYAGLDLAELLRQRYAPEVPEEVLLHLIAHGTDYSGTVLRWALPELSRLLDGLRRDGDIDEEAARRYLLELLDESEPPAGSLAHLRWRLDRAMQEVYLHDPAGAHAEQALAELKALAHTEILEEVDEALGRLAVPADPKPRGHAALPIARPVTPRIQREVTALIRKREHGEDAAVVSASPVTAPPPAIWPLPGLREVVVALLLPVLLVLGIRAAGLGSRELPNEDSAFTLEWLPMLDGKTSEAGYLRLSLDPRYGAAGLAGEIEGLRRPDKVRFTAFPEKPVIVPLTKQDRGFWVRALATAPDRPNLLSPQRQIPGQLPDGSLLVTYRSKLTGAEMPAVPFTATAQGTAAERPGTSDRPLTLPPGQWRITADIPEHGRWNTVVQVDPGTLSRRVIDVSAEHGLIEPTELPPHVTPADIRISGTPWDGKPLKVQPGPVEIAIAHDYYDYKTTVDVKANEHKRHPLKIKPTHGVLDLVVDPPYTKVGRKLESGRLKDYPIGRNGIYRLSHPAGKLLLLFNNGSETHARYFDIQAGKRLAAIEHTEPKPAKAAAPELSENDPPPDPRMPQACGKGSKHDPIKVGSVVVLGRHRPVQGQTDWNYHMDAFVGKTARVVSLSWEGAATADCPYVRVDADKERWVWRVRDLKLVEQAGEQPVAAATPPKQLSRTDPAFCEKIRRNPSPARTKGVTLSWEEEEMSIKIDTAVGEVHMRLRDGSNGYLFASMSRFPVAGLRSAVFFTREGGERIVRLPALAADLTEILNNGATAWEPKAAMGPFDSIFGCWGLKYGKGFLLAFNPLLKDFLIIDYDKRMVYRAYSETPTFIEWTYDEFGKLVREKQEARKSN